MLLFELAPGTSPLLAPALAACSPAFRFRLTAISCMSTSHMVVHWFAYLQGRCYVSNRRFCQLAFNTNSMPGFDRSTGPNDPAPSHSAGINGQDGFREGASSTVCCSLSSKEIRTQVERDAKKKIAKNMRITDPFQWYVRFDNRFSSCK
jgi:hypothetical protein